jgi:hypothetical protein
LADSWPTPTNFWDGKSPTRSFNIHIVKTANMVTIVDYKQRQNAEGKEFFTLSIQGGVEFVKSSKTGEFYATAWKSSITCTFNEVVCKSLIGKTLPGEIQKMEVEPYEYHLPETGETIMLSHKYRFNPEPNNPTAEEVVFQPESQAVKV